MTSPVIEVQGFRMAFGDKIVIDDLSFDVRPGETFGLLGSNGSGKTTTIRALLGIYTPTAGDLRVEGRRFDPAVNSALGYLPEERGLYKKEKVNPLGGCLPILIQMPIFFALYWVLVESVELRQAPWFGWIQDLTARDPYFILPLLMTASTMFQTWLNPTPADPMQARMMWIMPLIFSVMFFFFPAGLVLYWITNNILSIAQQWLINTRMGVPPQFNLPKFK